MDYHEENANTLEKNGVPKITYSKTQAVFAIIALVLGMMYYQFLFVGDFSGIRAVLPVVFAVVMCVYVLIFFRLHNISPGRETVFLATATVVYSLRIPFYGADDAVGYLCIATIHLSAMLMILSGKRHVCDKIADSSFVAVIKAPFASFFSLFAALPALFSKSGKSKAEKSSNDVGMVIIGIVISIPVVTIVTALLMADSFFAQFADDIKRLLEAFRFWDYVNPVSIFTAMYIFGATYTSGTGKKLSPTSTSFVSLALVNTVMITTGIVYVLFVIAQIEGYICMICGRLPEGLTYAEFARSGFFEICIVACINGLLLYGANARAHNPTVLSRTLSKIICIVTLFLIGTAAVKMGMYISAYGFTQKRFCTVWFMIVLAVIFSLSLAKLFRHELKLSEICTYFTAAMLLILFFVDFDALALLLNNLLGFAA